MPPPPTSCTTYAETASTGVPGLATWAPRMEPFTDRRSRTASREHVTRDRLCRALNVFVAAVGLIVAAPLMLVIAVLIKASSPGPAIYRQPRVGIDRRQSRGGAGARSRRRADAGGRIFTIYKFRTMRSDRGGSQIWSSKSDPRVTTVGKLLRATRLAS